jgi:hypothetical protein
VPLVEQQPLALVLKMCYFVVFHEILLNDALKQCVKADISYKKYVPYA